MGSGSAVLPLQSGDASCGTFPTARKQWCPCNLRVQALEASSNGKDALVQIALRPFPKDAFAASLPLLLAVWQDLKPYTPVCKGRECQCPRWYWISTDAAGDHVDVSLMCP